MKYWYSYSPIDTLFLRGSEPLVPGAQYETTNIFPPPASVISGAVRTAVLAQKNIAIEDYYADGGGVIDLIGKAGENPPFSVTSVLLEKNGKFYVPTPYSWMCETSKEKENKEESIKVKIVKPIDDNIVEKLGLKANVSEFIWAKHNKNIVTLGGNWLSLDAMIQKKDVLEVGKDIIIGLGDIMSFEERTGIGLDSNRIVEDGKLYTGKHIRLNDNIKIIWSLDRDCGLDESGIITIGGEQRFGRYQKMENVFRFPETGNLYMSLMPIKCSEVGNNNLFASGKIIYRGGWDLKKQFHRDMTGYYPAGSVFKVKINNSCIAI